MPKLLLFPIKMEQLRELALSAKLNLHLTLACISSSAYNKRQFVTTNANSFANRSSQLTSNPGITSEVTKRQHHAMDL